jgi:2-iminobutanoate/2-iminopropanoate deaminase
MTLEIVCAKSTHVESRHHSQEQEHSMPRQAFNSPRLAAPIGPFSQSVRSGELVFLSGQVGQDPTTKKLAEGGIAGQARQIFANVATLLEDLGLGLDDVVKVNVFLTSMDDFGAMNDVYAEQFAAPYPARTTVAVKALPMSALVEMEMIARAR